MKDNYWKLMSKKIIIILFIIMGISSDFNSSFSVEVGENFQDIFQNRPKEVEYCFDFVKVLPSDLLHEINIQGEGLKRTFDIDFVVVIIPTLEGRSITDFAVNLFSNWQIGKDTQGKKGILILIAMQEQRIKIEIGYDLEEVYTDLYVGQVEREMLKEFLEQADWERGFLATIENFVGRIYRMYKKGVDVKGITAEGGGGYYSEGAGAKTEFDFGAALNKPLPGTPNELRGYFGAQPTPELAFQRYMEFNTRNMNDYTVDLFTDISKFFFKYWKTATGQRRSEAEEVTGRPYIVKQKGNHAAIVFIEKDANNIIKNSPYLIYKHQKGWQMDINTMTRVFHVGPSLQVFWVDFFHPYIELFVDEYNYGNGGLVPIENDIGYLGAYYLGNGLYDEKEPGVHIAIWNDPQAKKIGLKTEDSILEINGQKVSAHIDVTRLLLRPDIKKGDKFHLKILRNAKPMELDITAVGLPDMFRFFKRCLEMPRVWLGIYFATTTEIEQEYAHTYCAILEVYPGGPADKAGLKPGDIIVSLNEKQNDIYRMDMWNHITQMQAGEKVRLGVLRDLRERKNITITAEETYHRGYF